MQTPYPCPSCRSALTQHRHAAGLSWVCTHCGGAALNLSVIRQHGEPKLVQSIWSQARASQVQSHRQCPSCSRALKVFDVKDASGTTELDGCVGCQFFWFDSTEMTRLGIELKARASASVRRAQAELQLETLREKRDGDTLVETIRDLVSYWFWWP